ncbi:hypothetical protein NDU88_005407 [Pleurodeles waltl]|uniref:Uncharacterized protein n=1 Tax=Pleurodeles waltl TaxID=8319 RepID=A0AAV7WDA4_PLEWA|nr:hypothetical protein NDU88_005407 [Pleurodeles waltl]
MGSGSIVSGKFVEPVDANAIDGGASGLIDEEECFVETGSSVYNRDWESNDSNGRSGMEEGVEGDSIASRVMFDGRIR